MFDPRSPTLKTSILSGRCLAATWFSLGSAAAVEIVARSGCDAIVLDLQHGLWDRRELEAVIGIVPFHVPVIVRVAENSPQAIATALDAGAEGIMVPLIEDEAAATRAVSACKYPPAGIRSGGGVRPLLDFASYVKGAEQIAVFLMIETAAGLANADAIARVRGVDMVFIGTGDLALSLGVSSQDQAPHRQACASILNTCREAARPCGIFTSSLEMAQARRTEGYRMVVVANDIGVLASGFAQAVGAMQAS